MTFNYPSTNQFRHVTKLLNKFNYDIIPFIGTVKIHGTNGNIILDQNGELTAYSKTNKLSTLNDNFNFCKFVTEEHPEAFKNLFTKIIPIINSLLGDVSYSNIIISGEYAGKGIQKGVAVSSVDKFFYIFGVSVSVDDEIKIRLPGEYFKDVYDEENRIFNAYHIKQFNISVNKYRPELIQNTLVELTNQVEEECPVGKYFGVSGIGEGIVYKPKDINFQSSDYWFKVKGEKHSSSKVKTLAEVDVEKLNSITEFVEYACTENRLEQALTETGPADFKNISTFMKWIMTDIYKEESDTLAKNGLTIKDVSKAISAKARNFYIKLINN